MGSAMAGLETKRSNSLLGCLLLGGARSCCSGPASLHDHPDFPASLYADGIMACVLIVDDNPLVRKAIRNLLTAAGVEICVEAVDGADDRTK
jgi:hypothetical protein